MVLGIGCYEGTELASARATNARLVLAHRCALVVKGLLEDGVLRHIILRGDDGNDAAQYDYNRSPESEADRFYDRFIAPEIFGRPEFPRRGYDSVLGPCEHYPTGWIEGVEWRGRFELALCRKVQNGLQLPYGAISVSIGNMEPEHIKYFAGVLNEAAFLSAHLYAAPNSKTIDDFDKVPWYMWRPLKIWLPECVRLGVRFPPVVATEVGTYYPYTQTGLTRQEYTRLCIDIVKALDFRFNAAGAKFIGGMGFGFGTVGTMETWRMNGTEGMISDEHPDYAQIFLPGQEAPVVHVGTGYNKAKPIVGTFLEDEIYHGNDGPPQTTSSMAIADKGTATWYKASNLTLAVTADGRVFGDKNGSLAELVEYVPKV